MTPATSNISRFARFLRHLLMRTRTGKHIHNRAYDAGYDAGLNSNSAHKGMPFCLYVANASANPNAEPDWRWFGCMDSRHGVGLILCGVHDRTPTQVLDYYLSMLRPEDARVVGHVEIHPDPQERLARLTELEMQYKGRDGEYLKTPTLIMMLQAGGPANLHQYANVRGGNGTLGDGDARPVLAEWLRLAGRRDLIPQKAKDWLRLAGRRDLIPQKAKDK